MSARRTAGALGLAAGLVSTAAPANVPFYFVAATLKLTVWWTIPVTLLVEAATLRWLFGIP